MMMIAPLLPSLRQLRLALCAAVLALSAFANASAQFTDVNEFVMDGTTAALSKEAFILTYGGDAGSAKYRSSLSVASHLDFTLLLNNADPTGRGSIGMIIGNSGPTPSSPITGFLPPWPTHGGTLILLVSYGPDSSTVALILNGNYGKPLATARVGKLAGPGCHSLRMKCYPTDPGDPRQKSRIEVYLNGNLLFNKEEAYQTSAFAGVKYQPFTIWGVNYSCDYPQYVSLTSTCEPEMVKGAKSKKK
jgi:hypothetical protein